MTIAFFCADNERFIKAPLEPCLPFLSLFMPGKQVFTSFFCLRAKKRDPGPKPGIPLITFRRITAGAYPNPYSSTFLYTVVNPIFNNLAASTLFPFV